MFVGIVVDIVATFFKNANEGFVYNLFMDD
jgi:hypothetical protein